MLIELLLTEQAPEYPYESDGIQKGKSSVILKKQFRRDICIKTETRQKTEKKKKEKVIYPQDTAI